MRHVDQRCTLTFPSGQLWLSRMDLRYHSAKFLFLLEISQANHANLSYLKLLGIYPVEFRDFFLGDMFCSETYAIGNIELFFCAYAEKWHPGQLPTCSSSASRWLGFLSTLPGIWRALQCIRR